MSLENKTPTIRYLNLDDIDIIESCLTLIVNELDDDSLFISPSIEYIKKIIAGYGRIAGVLEKNQLIGFASIVFPHQGRNNLGHFLGMNKENLLKVVQLEHICIIPLFQNNGYAKKLLNFLLYDVSPQYNIMLSTISPKNIKSLSIAFGIGQRIFHHSTIYGVSRYIMFGDLSLSKWPEIKPIKEVSVLDTENIISLLHNGFVGINFDKTKSYIQFTRKIDL